MGRRETSGGIRLSEKVVDKRSRHAKLGGRFVAAVDSCGPRRCRKSWRVVISQTRTCPLPMNWFCC